MASERPDRVRAEARQADPLYPTLFHEPWWLEAATCGQYREVTVSAGNRVIGRLPFVYQRRWGLRECALPNLVPFLGPAIDDGGGREVQRLVRRRRIVHELLDQLPPHSRFRQRLYGESVDALPFYERGFSTDAEFTHEIAPDTPTALWSNVRDTTRRVIRRAQERGRLIDLDPVEFGRLYEENLGQRGKLFNFSWKSEVSPALEAGVARGRAKLLGAIDSRGRVGAAVFFAWDDKTTHLLLMTRSLDAHSGMIGWLIWEAIQHSARAGRIFDFGGVGTQGSFLFYGGFGGQPRPRIVVQRATAMFRVLDLTARKSRTGMDRALAPVTRTLSRMRDRKLGNEAGQAGPLGEAST